MAAAVTGRRPTMPNPALVRPAVKGLASLGFVQASPAAETAQLLVVSQAQEKKGKTHFAFTAPGPIAVITTDTGTEEVANKFSKAGKVIHLLKAATPKSLGDQDAAVAEWEKLYAGWMGIVADRTVRTLVVDTLTEFWQTMRLAWFGKLEQVPPKKYDEVNAAMRALVKMVKDRRDLNAVFIHKVKKEYAGTKKPDGSAGMDSWTGRWERAGFGDMGYLADVVIEHQFATPGETGKRAPQYPPGVSEREFYVRVVDSRYEAQAVIGECLSGDACDFPTLACMLLPDTDPVAWMDAE